MCPVCQREEAMRGTMKGDLRWHQQEREKDGATIESLRATVAGLEKAIMNAAIALEKCPKVQRGIGGQTVDACLGRTRFNGVPYSVYSDLRTALGGEAVKQGKGETCPDE